MNPLFMMFGPMGFMGGGCGCGVYMPYYGQNDTLTFMNFPVFRNTSMDYLLDPRLAMWQVQQNWMNGGSFGMMGNSYLPLFNNFPGMNPPWMNTKTETEEEKKKREEKEAEEKKPENVAKKAKIDDYKTYFERFKTLVDKNVKETADFKTLVTNFENALKEEKLDDRLAKVKEVLSQIDKDMLTKIALADTDIDSKLYKIGYNFPTKTSRHVATELETKINDMIATLNLSDSTKVGGQLNSNILKPQKDYILQMISSWNDTHNDDEKGIIRGLAKYMPENDDKQQQQYKEAIEGVTETLVLKADAFIKENGGATSFPKLSEQLKSVQEKLSDIQKVAYKDKNDTVKKADVLALADETDKLYAMIRVQEAKILNKEVVTKYAEQMNDIKADAIPNDIIIKETFDDLSAEKITIPSDSELDVIPEKDQGFRVSANSGKTKMEEIDEAAAGDPEKRIQLLVENQKLKAVQGYDGIYETKTDDTNAPKKYYAVSEENKLVEVKLNAETNQYEAISGTDITAVEIGQYTETVDAIDKYIRQGKIKKSSINNGSVYLSVDKHPDKHSDAFVIRDNKLVKIKGRIYAGGSVLLDSGERKMVSQLNDDDVTEVTSERDIYTKPAAPSAPSQPSKPAQGAQSGNNKTKAATKTKIDINSDAYKLGDDVATTIEGDTEDECYEDVNNALNSVTKDTAFNFLAGFYSHNFHEGIIEYLDDEWEMNSDEYSITLDAKKNLITSFVEFAISKGISENDSRIRTINRILKKYEETEDTKFNNGNWFNFTRGFWNGVTSIVGDGKSDNEVIDDKLKSLFNELKKD